MKYLELICVVSAASAMTLEAAAQPGSIDASFAANIQAGGGANSSVYCVATDVSGNVFVGGAFTQFAGLPANRIAKILVDGTLDATFTAAVGLIGNDVKAITVQADGKILIGGNFTSVGGTPRPNIARLNTDGSLDASFTPALNLPVFCLAIQPDGAIVAGGQFFFNPGFTRRGLIRLLPDGTTDASFNPGSGADNTVRAVEIDAAGRIIIAGAFDSFNGAAAGHIAVLAPDGSAFAPFAPTSGLDGPAFALETFDDGRILVGGDFDHFDGTSSPALVCLTYTGVLHPTMITSGFDASSNVSTIHRDLNGLAVAAGNFAAYGGEPRAKILRLLDDGAMDASFVVGSGFAGTVVVALASDPSGRLVAGGTFNGYQGTSQNGLTRIENCLQHVYYPDLDGDGLGDDSAPLVSCSPPSGYVDDHTDCNDGDFVIRGPSTWFEDLDGDGTGNPVATLLSCLEPVGYVLDNTDCDDQDPDRYEGAVCDDGDPTTVFDMLDANCICTGGAIDVAARVFLDGPLVGATMSDGLRAAGLLPLTEPYTLLGFHPGEPGGGEQIAGSVLTITGPDAIVDWVMICLRDDDPPHPRKNIRMALLQRDGDIVDLDGTSPVRFSQLPGPFMLEVRHRNHLGIMSAQAMPQVPTGTLLTMDFTSPATACYGTNARKVVGPVTAMWSGNTRNNGSLAYTGPNNDRDPILLIVGSLTPNNVVPGYLKEDVTLNGTVTYTGAGNDRDRILVNVGSTTPNNVRLEQIP